MAYENGYNALDYIGGCYRRYQQDPMIFQKVSNLLMVYKTRSDWPHNLMDFDNAFHTILGASVSNLIFDFGFKYLYDERIEWPEEAESFKHELRAFYTSIYPFLIQGFYATTHPMKFYNIATSPNDNHKIIRFMRVDGSSIEFIMEDQEIRGLISLLEGLLEKRGEER
ncbi:hypothetical protein [Effusibacillus lacus]|uniref:Uncharacterized protein n=1 Tax=Effusibacillus lacus TaxID=1348429 RepID=A0A292YEW0_9BACL|nr:hypothetical protein [Effusibacillus lacus]TCS73712.1 hypothetical protein EDD64_11612 [Effusibacillus lacus]GAX92072.1 hypothetical protein EFBL_3763 [Effusibacillus lacus]